MTLAAATGYPEQADGSAMQMMHMMQIQPARSSLMRTRRRAIAGVVGA
ncbi:MAG: hypothetical protein K8H88_04045 [Sandaracinaceae bacterium]|nr:hypothetical protein [Sandaracinaceae bacterium]